MFQTEKKRFSKFYLPNDFSVGGGNSIESIEFAGRRVEEMLHRDSEFPPLATKLKIPGEQQIIPNNWLWILTQAWGKFAKCKEKVGFFWMQVFLFDRIVRICIWIQLDILRYFQDPWEVCQDFRKQTIHQEQQAVAPQTTVRRNLLRFLVRRIFYGRNWSNFQSKQRGYVKWAR